MAATRPHKNTRLQSVRYFFIALIVIVIGVIIWYNVPVKLLPKNVDSIAEIHLKDGNTGREMTISNSEAVHFIVEELNCVYFKRDGLALGFGTSYRLSFISGDMTTKTEIIIQTGKQAKKGIFFYKPLDDTQDLIALSVYLQKVLSWMQNGEEEFPTPPQNEDFIVPDLPSDELLNKTYPLITDQISYYIRSDNGWISKSISDQERIDDIIGEISFSSLRALAPAKQRICEPDIYIDFNNGTVLACSESPTYIWFGHQIDTAQDENESISFYGEYIGPYSVRDRDLSDFLLRWMEGDIVE